MKVLIAALALASTPALANWVSVTSTAEAHVFANTQVRVHDGKPALWVRFDKRAGDGSTVLLMEFDCRAQSYRRVSFTQYAKAQAQGAVLSTSAEASAWRAAAPDTAPAILLPSVCP